jgi:hypothetical protein
MRVSRLCWVLVGSVALTASAVSSASGAVATGSGDTCSAVGHGDSYSLTVNVASAGPAQYGFAFGAASGVTVESIVVPGIEGSFLTAGVPQGTSATWINSIALTPGPVNVTVTTSAAVGSFSVLPASAPSSATYFDPIVCKVTAAKAPIPSAAFAVERRAPYDPVAKAWRLSVTIASSGRVSAVEPEPTVGTAAPSSTTEKPLVRAKRLSLKSPGKLTFMLRPTSRGQSMLATSGSIKLRLAVTFIPTGGKAATKSVSLVLKK